MGPRKWKECCQIVSEVLNRLQFRHSTHLIVKRGQGARVMASFGRADAILHGGHGLVRALRAKVVVRDRLHGGAVVVASKVDRSAIVARVGGNGGERGGQDGANSQRKLHDDDYDNAREMTIDGRLCSADSVWRCNQENSQQTFHDGKRRVGIDDKSRYHVNKQWPFATYKTLHFKRTVRSVSVGTRSVKTASAAERVARPKR